MSAEVVLQRLRRFLLVLAGLMCVATVVELGFEEHWENPIQVLPFVLCGAGLIAVTLFLAQPTRVSVHVLRWTMGVVFVGGLFGLFEHIEHNLEFALEIHPNAAAGELLLDALGGANPLLAPGILALAALIAVAATYYHPALRS